MPKNVRDFGKLIVAKGFKKLPKVQKITRSGHTDEKLHGLTVAVAFEECDIVDPDESAHTIAAPDAFNDHLKRCNNDIKGSFTRPQLA